MAVDMSATWCFLDFRNKMPPSIAPYESVATPMIVEPNQITTEDTRITILDHSRMGIGPTAGEGVFVLFI